MRQIDIERFNKIEELLPDVLTETEKIVNELGENNSTVYPLVRDQLFEIKRMVDSGTIPVDKDKKRIRVGYLIIRENECETIDELPDYDRSIIEISRIFSELGDPPKFKYFANPKDEAAFINIPCECCGGTEYCLDGRYFGRGAKTKSVCAFCLAEGKSKVFVPNHIQSKLLNHLHEFYPDKSDNEIKEIALGEISELERTPPVPWLTENEWPVANGDFARYKYPMEKDLFSDGKEELFRTLEGIEKVKDREELWKKIGKKITIFGFSIVGIEKYSRITVAQSLDVKTVKKVWR